MATKQHAVKLDKIRIDGGTQPRTEINTDLVGEYAYAMGQGVVFPPVVLFYDGVDHWLADGFHRYHAAKNAGWPDIGADIHEGTKRDAVLFSVGANQTHGQRRSNADKRKAALTLLADAEWFGWTNVEIGRRCGVSEALVRELRPQSPHFVLNDVTPRSYTTKHGTVATMNTENIGKPFKSREEVAKRREKLKEMAGGGYSMTQITAALCLSEERVNTIAKEDGIDLSAAKITARHGKHDSNRIVEHIVMDAENLTADTDLIVFSALDRARLQAWIESLVQSRRSLDAFIKVLREETKNGEAA